MSNTEFNGDVPRIAALQGATRETIQATLAEFVARARLHGMRLAGVIETTCDPADPGCRSLALEDVSTGAVFSISQDLGPGSTACNLDPGGLAAACAAVERAIREGADLVVLSKFGKQEAARSGLCDAFRAAIQSGLPILTAVSPALAEPWRQFAGSLSAFLPADIAALEAWRQNVALRALAVAAE
jgi:hypothetical protein